MYVPRREEVLLWGGMKHGFFSPVPLSYPCSIGGDSGWVKASNFGFSIPVREILFTTIPLEDRYKAKNFIDKVVYHVIDQLGPTPALLELAWALQQFSSSPFRYKLSFVN